jgi:hypothetical protein
MVALVREPRSSTWATSEIDAVGSDMSITDADMGKGNGSPAEQCQRNTRDGRGHSGHSAGVRSFAPSLRAPADRPSLSLRCQQTERTPPKNGSLSFFAAPGGKMNLFCVIVLAYRLPAQSSAAALKHSRHPHPSGGGIVTSMYPVGGGGGGIKREHRRFSA